MIIQVFHETTYNYDHAFKRSIQLLRMTPPNTERQTVLDWHLRLPQKATPWRDAYGNLCHCLTLEEAAKEIVLCAEGTVSLKVGHEGAPEGLVPPAVFLRSTTLTQMDESMRAFIEPFQLTVKSRPYMGLHDVMMALLDKMPYEKGITRVGDTASQSFALRRGVCQDHTHVFLSCARHLGLPARYVSGYLHAGELGDVASHAWAEVWVGSRWIGFDVSNSNGADQGHIRLSHGLDYEDACPVRGVRTGGGTETMRSYAKVESSHPHQQ